eukprot:29013-Pelagococcus_subviridis.AAC.2
MSATREGRREGGRREESERRDATRRDGSTENERRAARRARVLSTTLTSANDTDRVSSRPVARWGALIMSYG